MFFQKLKKALQKQRFDWSSARVPEGEVVQAVGDIHGCIAEMQSLIANLSELQFSEKSCILVFLGDLIDRGPESQKVVDWVVSEQSKKTVVALRGNHEQMLLNFMASPEKAGSNWFKNGGVETLRSYGVHVSQGLSPQQLVYCRDEFAEKLPASHRIFFENMPLSHERGDYFFCHAAVDHTKSLSQQSERDLLWSRNTSFLDDNAIEKMIVHGHTPVREPLEKTGHINIDTGAYLTGTLTALSMCGDTREFVQVKA